MIRRYAVTLIVTCAVASAAVTAWAQDAPEAGMPAKMALTIPEAIELAWRNNIQSIRSENSLHLAEAGRMGARGTYLPSVSVGGSWRRSRSSQDLTIDSAGTTILDTSIVDKPRSYGADISVTQPLFNGFRYIHEPAARTATVRQNEQSFRSTRQKIALDAKRAAYDLLKAQMLVEVQERAVERSQEQLETSNARYELGSASMSDFLKSKVQLGQDSLLLITRQKNEAVSRATLNDLLGLPVDRPTEIDAQLEFEPYPLPSASAMTQAIDVHPDVLSAHYGVSAANHQIGSARSDQFPSLSLFANYGYSNFTQVEVQENISFERNSASVDAVVGLRLDWTLFSGFQTNSLIKQAKIRKHTAESEWYQAKRSVHLAIKTASLGVDEARRRHNVSEEQVRSAQEDLNIAQEKYNLGAATILDILNAQVSLSQAETDKIQAVFDYNLAVAELEKAMGGGD